MGAGRDGGGLALGLLAQGCLGGGASAQRAVGRVCGVALGFRGTEAGRGILRRLRGRSQPGGGLHGGARSRADRGHVGGSGGLWRGPRVGTVVEVHGRTTGDDNRVAPAGRGRRGVRGGLDGSVVEDGGRGRLWLRRCARLLVGGLRVARVAEDREGALARDRVAVRGRGLLGHLGGGREGAGGSLGQRRALGGLRVRGLCDHCRCRRGGFIASDRRHRRGLGPACILGFGRGLRLGCAGRLRPTGVSRLGVALGCRLRGGLIKRGRLRDPASGLGRLRGMAGVRGLRRRAGRRRAARGLPDLRGHAHGQAGDLIDGLFDVGCAGAA